MFSIVRDPIQWFVPCHLARDVLSGATLEDIVQKDEPKWNNGCLKTEHQSGLFRRSRNMVNFMNTSIDFSKWEYFIYPEGLPVNIDSHESKSVDIILDYTPKRFLPEPISIRGTHNQMLFTLCFIVYITLTISRKSGTPEFIRIKTALWLANSVPYT
ncbi:hypothetical protein PIB30_051544 [Stylosanthes scabra]|uniref:Sulfotransferase n=1 Tax=Stylosanthes scabra TaxID=79078 RepID=A0ABU6WG13_9FABA|nr:hypothetical protein [Stylosanthes scabra]